MTNRIRMNRFTATSGGSVYLYVPPALTHSLRVINPLVLGTKTQLVSCAVRTEYASIIYKNWISYDA
jgi:hypothetical protein